MLLQTTILAIIIAVLLYVLLNYGPIWALVCLATFYVVAVIAERKKPSPG